MSHTPWDPQTVCEMAIASLENRTCCGRTTKGASCQNRIKLSVIKKGHQKLVSLAGRPLDLATLELALRDVAKSFLCARWHQSQQCDGVAHRWYQTAVHHEMQLNRAGHSPRPTISRPPMSPSISTQPSEVDSTDQVSLDESRLTPPSGPSYTSAATAPSPSMGSFVTAATLRANNVPWEISAERPAFLSCVTNIRAGVQGIELHSLRCSDDYPDIHCIFCLGEDEDNTRETVVLRCVQCSTLSHLACMEGWLEKRDTGFDTSCCVCRNEGALDAFIRPGACATDAPIVTTDSATNATTIPNTRTSHPSSARQRSRSVTMRRGLNDTNSRRRQHG